MKKMKTIKDFNVKGKKVLVRCDFNVPLDSKGKIIDDFRIKQTLPTLKYLEKQGAKLILMSHRSDGNNLDVVWQQIRKYLKTKDIVFLKNLRFNKGEKKNSNQFARKLAGLADIYVNDAFGACHRNHASIVGVSKYLPSGAGFLLEKEVKILSQVLRNPKRPLVAIIGGVKITSKAKVINQFLKISEDVLIGGRIGMDFSFTSPKLHIPIDYNENFDIGPQTIKIFSRIIKNAKTIVWAGPMGKFEDKLYEKGTKKIAQEIANSRAFKIAGGGDTVSALRKYKLRNKFDHVSTGGGAMLSFLSGDELPGLKALDYYGNKKLTKGSR